MSTKSEALAAKYEKATKDFAVEIKGLSDGDWQAKTLAEGWTVAVTAHHAAGISAPMSQMVKSVATGSPMPEITADGLDQANAEHAKEFAKATRDEALQLLRETSEPAAELIRGLQDEQLARKAMLPLGMEMTAEQTVEAMIGHIGSHAASIQAAVSERAG
jgi:Mycothiol maleylpyruvate isomerase N-terminal domain